MKTVIGVGFVLLALFAVAVARGAFAGKQRTAKHYR